MSHITKVQTQITDLGLAEKALSDLGLDVRRDAMLVGWSSRTMRVPLACLSLSTDGYGIGLRAAADGTYEVLADWWFVGKRAGLSQDDFLQKLRQRYAYLQVKKALDENGFRVVEESVDSQKSIRLEVVKWR